MMIRHLSRHNIRYTIHVHQYTNTVIQHRHQFTNTDIRMPVLYDTVVTTVLCRHHYGTFISVFALIILFDADIAIDAADALTPRFFRCALAFLPLDAIDIRFAYATFRVISLSLILIIFMLRCFRCFDYAASFATL